MTYAEEDSAEQDSQEQDSAGDDSLPLEAIEQACLRFEAAWTQGPKPDLAEYLCEFAGAAQRHALCDLLWIEWDHLRRLGTPPQLDDYRLRFADFLAAVEEAWRSDFRRTASEGATNSVLGARYTIIKPHARGGFGQVYVAHDDELGREVALKEIQERHAKSPSIQDRFVREAKITGKLEHPGVVPVYSAGKKPDGTPFYAMRFVQGESLKSAIDEFHLRHPGQFQSRAFRQLLARFVSICNVMDYAHSRGVLHRDLKPGNIMLGRHGETLVVDWGLAKEAGQPEPCGAVRGIGPSLTNMSFTTHGALIGTPSYMSPEQAAGKLGDMTAASDIYSLGATMYHLLAGRAPLADEAQAETLMLRIQRGEIPRVRSVQPTVPAPLDAICANAMSLDPADRYPSAAALALDLEHWLADEAVSTYREPLIAQTLRWARRHQTASVSGILAVLLLALASAGIAVLIAVHNRQLTLARHTAEEKQIAAEVAKGKAETAQATAEFERDLSKAIAKFMVDCFRSPDPELDGNKITVAEILDRSFLDVKNNTEISAESKSRFLEALIDSNVALGRYSQAVQVAEYGWDYCQQHLKPNDNLLIVMQCSLAISLLEDGQFAKAVDSFENVVKNSVSHFGADHPETFARQRRLAEAYFRAGRRHDGVVLAKRMLQLAHDNFESTDEKTIDAEHDFATMQLRLGEFDTAIKTFQRVLSRDESRLHAGHPTILTAQNSLAQALEVAGRYDEALTLQRTLLDSRKSTLGTLHPFTLNTQNNLASTLQSCGKYAEAIELFANTIELRKTQLGREHPVTLSSISRLGSVYIDARQFANAIELLRENLQRQLRLFGDEDVDTLNTQKRLASALVFSGATAEAIILLEAVVPKFEKTYGSRHYLTSSAKGILAQAYRSAGRANDATILYRDVLRNTAETFGRDHPECLILQSNLATALTTAERYEEAATIYEDSLSKYVTKFGSQHPGALQIKVNLAVCSERSGAVHRAMMLFDGIKLPVVESLGWEHPLTLQVHIGLARCFDEIGQHDNSASLLEYLIAQLEAHLPKTHVHTITAKRYLSKHLAQAGKVDEAIAKLDPLLVELREQLGQDNSQTLSVKRDLASLFRKVGRIEDAARNYRELVEIAKQTRGDPIALAEDMYWLGMCEIKLKRFVEAEQTLRECLEMRQRELPGRWETKESECLLGQSLVGQGKYEAAELYLTAGFDGMQTLRDTVSAETHDKCVRHTIEQLVELYELSGNNSAANWWRAKIPGESAPNVTP